MENLMLYYCLFTLFVGSAGFGMPEMLAGATRLQRVIPEVLPRAEAIASNLMTKYAAHCEQLQRSIQDTAVHMTDGLAVAAQFVTAHPIQTGECAVIAGLALLQMATTSQRDSVTDMRLKAFQSSYNYRLRTQDEKLTAIEERMVEMAKHIVKVNPPADTANLRESVAYPLEQDSKRSIWQSVAMDSAVNKLNIQDELAQLRRENSELKLRLTTLSNQIEQMQSTPPTARASIEPEHTPAAPTFAASSTFTVPKVHIDGVRGGVTSAGADRFGVKDFSLTAPSVTFDSPEEESNVDAAQKTAERTQVNLPVEEGRVQKRVIPVRPASPLLTTVAALVAVVKVQALRVVVQVVTAVLGRGVAGRGLEQLLQRTVRIATGNLGVRGAVQLA